MSLSRYINRIRRLDALIRRKSTKPPCELARKLDISERWLYMLLDELKEELDCPIQYDRHRRSYIYGEKGSIAFGFQKKLSKKEEKKISGGEIVTQKCETLYLFMQ